MTANFFIDIHTHSPSKKGEWVIQNIHSHFDQLPSYPFSAGLHPWFIEKETWETAFRTLAKISSDINMLALGECGLDRVCATNYEFQKEVFTQQVKLANQINKPLILHCVRAHEDVLHLLEAQKNNVPVIFHGFNRGLILAQKIISKGYYVSFGAAVERSHMQEIFASLPLQHIFLETDDAEISIQSIYERAASSRNISMEELCLQLQQNLQTVFKINL